MMEEVRPAIRPRDVAYQASSKRSGAATMLLCDRCNRVYHARCLLPALPGVAWW
jgi:hypothetical protein